MVMVIMYQQQYIICDNQRSEQHLRHGHILVLQTCCGHQPHYYCQSLFIWIMIFELKPHQYHILVVVKVEGAQQEDTGKRHIVFVVVLISC